MSKSTVSETSPFIPKDESKQPDETGPTAPVQEPSIPNKGTELDVPAKPTGKAQKLPDPVDVICFLLDRELRRDLVNGRKSRAQKCIDLVHALGKKTVQEQEEEAEADRISKLKSATPSDSDPNES
jgi:hypothetical protein